MDIKVQKRRTSPLLNCTVTGAYFYMLQITVQVRIGTKASNLGHSRYSNLLLDYVDIKLLFRTSTRILWPLHADISVSTLYLGLLPHMIDNQYRNHLLLYTE